MSNDNNIHFAIHGPNYHNVFSTKVDDTLYDQLHQQGVALNTIDKNSDGKLTYDEFFGMLGVKSDQIDQYKNLFSQMFHMHSLDLANLDRSKDGFMDSFELGNFIMHGNTSLYPEEAQAYTGFGFSVSNYDPNQQP